MANIKSTILTVVVIECNVLEKAILEIYGKRVELAAAEEWSNDSQHLYTIDGSIDRWDVENLRDFFDSDVSGHGITRQLLNKLVHDKHLKPGNYLVTVFW